MKFLPLIIIIFFALPQFGTAQDKKAPTKTNISSPLQSVRGFLKWYGDNYRRMYKYRMTYTDTTGNYRVNIPECTGYFKELLSSGYISHEYVRLWCDYCLSEDEKFIISPQNEGPPEGFDMDLVLLTQEPDEVTKNYNKFSYRTEKTDSTSAVVIADTGWRDWVYVFELSKIKNRWYIDYISIKEPGDGD